jgi:thiamine pyrophosphate-dependent acetolactate synthase large subunit-like protein
VIRSLEELDVEVIFGIPGGAVLPVYDPLFDSQKLRHVLVRHEQGAGHAASGYAHATGKVGVCMATSGPGATNLVTPLADAQMDSIPVVAITGQVGRALIGTDAFQEADISGITMPITKHNFLVRDWRRDPAGDGRGLPHRVLGASGRGARRHPQRRSAGPVHVQLAAENGPARLQAEHQTAQPAGA